MANKFKIRSFNKPIAAAATAEAIGEGKAREVILVAADGNSADDMLVGDSDAQTFPLKKGQPLKLRELLNRMSFGGEYDLSKIFVKAGTNGDVVNVLVTEEN